MAVVKWQFYDGTTTYTFDINPNEGGSPQYERNVTYQTVSAPDGKVLVFEGRDQPQEIQFSGVILNQSQHDAFVEWYYKMRQIRITDDLGRQYWVRIKSYKPKRERARSYAWKHSYEMTAVIVDWP